MRTGAAPPFGVLMFKYTIAGTPISIYKHSLYCASTAHEMLRVAKRDEWAGCNCCDLIWGARVCGCAAMRTMDEWEQGFSHGASGVMMKGWPKTAFGQLAGLCYPHTFRSSQESHTVVGEVCVLLVTKADHLSQYVRAQAIVIRRLTHTVHRLCQTHLVVSSLDLRFALPSSKCRQAVAA
ncbi:hypothetical protein BC835DRAFT_850414 [Cytidiella melzeri]|nr:hypothetical protein BC835DRAFT_850414 [Cytidiella melzeri]